MNNKSGPKHGPEKSTLRKKVTQFRNTIEYLGLWEALFNPSFNPLEFEGFRSQAGLNAFTLSPSQWIEATNAIGLFSRAGWLTSGRTCAERNSLIYNELRICPWFKMTRDKYVSV